MLIWRTSHAVSLALACGALLTAACAVRTTSRDMTIEECGAAEMCQISGLLTMSSDGHGFIGELAVADGKCVNVSLPTRVSTELIDKPPRPMSVLGNVIGFPFGQDLAHFKVNGRRVGFGKCGDFFVFVK